MFYDPKDFPAVITLCCKDADDAEAVLHHLELYRAVGYNQEEKGKNIYYVDDIERSVDL